MSPGKQLGILTKDKEGTLGVCGNGSSWRKLSIAMDSGACDNVISPDDVPEQVVQETEASGRGENFYSATGEPIPNLGLIELPMFTREGTARAMRMSAAKVSKPLGPVKKVCKAGHCVVFDDEGSFIYNKLTQEVNWLREDEGNYMLDVWIPPVANQSASQSTGFGRHP